MPWLIFIKVVQFIVYKNVLVMLFENRNVYIDIIDYFGRSWEGPKRNKVYMALLNFHPFPYAKYKETGFSFRLKHLYFY